MCKEHVISCQVPTSRAIAYLVDEREELFAARGSCNTTNAKITHVHHDLHTPCILIGNQWI